MSVLTLIAILSAIHVFVWAIWFVIELIRYVSSGEYEIDKRLREISQ